MRRLNRLELGIALAGQIALGGQGFLIEVCRSSLPLYGDIRAGNDEVLALPAKDLPVLKFVDAELKKLAEGGPRKGACAFLLQETLKFLFSVNRLQRQNLFEHHLQSARFLVCVLLEE